MGYAIEVHSLAGDLDHISGRLGGADRSAASKQQGPSDKTSTSVIRCFNNPTVMKMMVRVMYVHAAQTA